MQEVPRDGETIGEVMFRGNIVMKGYQQQGLQLQRQLTEDLPKAARRDAATTTPKTATICRYNFRVQVEDVLFKHPAVLFAAVVARPDAKWGEVPCAFVELKDDAQATETEISRFAASTCRASRTPKAVVFGPLPKMSNCKIQKFVLRQEVKSAKAISP